MSNTNLTNTSFVHANLTQATFIKADWIGADLIGATLTGAKLHSASRFGLKTEGMICEWVDLSPKGDRSIIQKFEADYLSDFFNETPPTICISVDAALEPEANFALAGAYFHIAQEYRLLQQPPSMEIGRRRTVFTFRLDNDEALLPTACIAILPFKDAALTQKNIYQVLELLNKEDISDLDIKISHRVKQLTTLIEQAIIDTPPP